MCTYSITLNDNLVNQVRSEFPNDEALQQWLEDQIEDVLIRYKAQKRLEQVGDHESIQTDEQGCLILTKNMREAVQKAEQSLATGTCLTEEMFQARFAKWL